MSAPPLLILGCGFAGRAVAREARAQDPARRIVGTTRDPEHAAALGAEGIEAVVGEGEALLDLASGAAGWDVVVTIPPIATFDDRCAGALRSVRALVYLSSTGVYGDRRGRIDESTPVDPATPKAAARLASERAYRSVGAVVLRCAGIYGPGRGLHLRIGRGDYRIPGDGSNVVSRIHVGDLARVTLAALAARAVERVPSGAIYVVADDAPVPQIEAIRWLCERLGRPLPPSVPIAEAPETLRHDRSVDNACVKRELGVTLAYPSYREGFAACLADGARIN